MTILDEEVLRWISVTDALPDDDQTVLVFAPACDEPVWPGYHDEDGWYAAEGTPYAVMAPVIAWARMPKGVMR
jgi:hypothetical protein